PGGSEPPRVPLHLSAPDCPSVRRRSLSPPPGRFWAEQQPATQPAVLASTPLPDGSRSRCRSRDCAPGESDKWLSCRRNVSFHLGTARSGRRRRRPLPCTHRSSAVASTSIRGRDLKA